MPNREDIVEEYIHGTDWWSRGIVIAVIVLTVIFVREILDIFRAMGMEPIALIAMVGGIVAGEFSILYFIFRNKKEMVRESIRYERDYEVRPSSMPFTAPAKPASVSEEVPLTYEQEPADYTEELTDFEQAFPAEKEVL